MLVQVWTVFLAGEMKQVLTKGRVVQGVGLLQGMVDDFVAVVAPIDSFLQT